MIKKPLILVIDVEGNDFPTNVHNAIKKVAENFCYDRQMHRKASYHIPPIETGNTYVSIASTGCKTYMTVTGDEDGALFDSWRTAPSQACDGEWNISATFDSAINKLIDPCSNLNSKYTVEIAICLDPKELRNSGNIRDAEELDQQIKRLQDKNIHVVTARRDGKINRTSEKELPSILHKIIGSHYQWNPIKAGIVNGRKANEVGMS